MEDIQQRYFSGERWNGISRSEFVYGRPRGPHRFPEVIIAEELKPERSVNVNINYLKKIYSDNGTFIGLDASAFYTRFSNVILPDYETNPNQIIYDNLNGKSVSQGLSANLDVVFPSSFKIMVGATWQDVSSTENGVTKQQILTESITATWNLSYTFHSLKLTADYTGNLYGPMRLPLLGELDPRQEYSPTWSIQNIQFTYKGLNNFEVYGGIKTCWTGRQTVVIHLSLREPTTHLTQKLRLTTMAMPSLHRTIPTPLRLTLLCVWTQPRHSRVLWVTVYGFNQR